jgi:hypothetical protein
MKSETDYLEDQEVDGRIKLKWKIDCAIFVGINIGTADDLL